ncbi:hypothetical protein ATCC90586_004022 [Pythium insidiosum]|nr:hypothetical protein ATCC90586_004022 [Pythium insidiosum]
MKKATVDVSSIKKDILKALAEARNAIADIKKETSVVSQPKVQPTLASCVAEPEAVENPPPSQVPDGTDVSSQSVSPPSKQVASADVDEFDMFSAAELHDRGLSPVSLPPAPGHGVDAVVSSNCDDPEGYYQPTAGEVLNGTYQKHCVRLLERFEHRGHVALVFESMQMNLREAMKKFGGRGGISVQAVRVFCKHMLIALSHLESSGVVHADIKPDNILLDEKQTMVKLCDFGSAFKVDEGKHDPTPYLMFTGKVMFPGATNNEMLKLFMELKGKFPNKTIKKHRQAYIDQIQMEPHFTEDNKFCSREIDRVTDVLLKCVTKGLCFAAELLQPPAQGPRLLTSATLQLYERVELPQQLLEGAEISARVGL